MVKNKISLETKNKISEDFKNNISIKDIMNKYNISRASVFRIKKDITNEKVNEIKELKD
jgi:Mor family transcriptional regulator